MRILPSIMTLLTITDQQLCSKGATLSPISRIPAEMVLKIFSHSIEESEYVVASTDQPPWSLSQVSQNWRRLSTTTPELWSSLFFITKNISASHIEMLNAWLGRSRNRPLTVAYRLMPNDEGEYDEELFEEAFKVLMRHMVQWQKIDIDLQAANMLPITASMNTDSDINQPEYQAPILRSLILNTVTSDDGDEDDDEFCSEDVVNELLSIVAPRLDVFEWYDSNSNNPDLERRSLFFHHSKALRSLSLHSEVHQEEAPRILSTLPLLEKCSFALGTMPPDGFVVDPFVHSSLRELEVATELFLTALFEPITLPALERLQVKSARYSEEETLSFIDCLARSGLGTSRINTTLLSFKWEIPANFSDEVLLTLLRMLPSLEYLYIEGLRDNDTWDPPAPSPGVTERVLKELSADANGAFRLCPNLRGFSFIKAIKTRIAKGILPGLIQSRVSAFPPGVAKVYHGEAGYPDFIVDVDFMLLDAEGHDVTVIEEGRADLGWSVAIVDTANSRARQGWLVNGH